MTDTTIHQALANLEFVFGEIRIIEPTRAPVELAPVATDWRSVLNAAHTRGSTVALGANGHDLILRPGSLRWPTATFRVLVEHQDEIREALRKRKETTK